MIRASYQLPTDLWPHQGAGIGGVISAYMAGLRRLVLTAPCGSGKTRMMIELLLWAMANGMPAALYTSRRMLFKQTCKVLENHGIEFGVRASGEEPALLRDVQIAMTQSELSAVYKKQKRGLHHAKLVLIDEIHMQGGNAMQQIIQDHHAAGATVVAFTATPLDLEGEWDRLIVAGTNSDLRRCGAHVPAVCYCPDVPDLKHIKKYKVGEDIQPDSDLWRRLQIDSQISMYVLAARRLGYPVECVLYNVTRKPTIKPTAIPLLDELGVKIVLDRDSFFSQGSFLKG